jgi:hypothetical protein
MGQAVMRASAPIWAKLAHESDPRSAPSCLIYVSGDAEYCSPGFRILRPGDPCWAGCL